MFARKSSSAQSKPLSEVSDPPAGVFDDAAGRFAELYGGSRVAATRMFVVALVSALVSIAAVAGVVYLSNSNVAMPYYVEVNKEQGLVSRPVRIENLRPSDAVVKAELARWITKVFTIDSIQTPQLMRDANQMTKGLGTSQFAEFRLKQNILDRMMKDPSLQRKVTISSVDSSQPGIAFAFLTTQEAQGTTASTAIASWRVTVRYELAPPRTEQEILANPLGVYVTSLNYTQEGSVK